MEHVAHVLAIIASRAPHVWPKGAIAGMLWTAWHMDGYTPTTQPLNETKEMWRFSIWRHMYDAVEGEIDEEVAEVTTPDPDKSALEASVACLGILISEVQ